MQHGICFAAQKVWKKFVYFLILLSEVRIPNENQVKQLKSKSKMKKACVTLLMLSLVPTMKDFIPDYGICRGEEFLPQEPNWADIEPRYSSYFDYSDGFLYIYGGLQYTVITVKVTHNGQTVVMDVLSPNDLPTQYDFNGCDSGSYYVTISAGITLLTSFSFNLL